MELDFAVVHPGDEHFKAAVQQARIMMPVRRTEGMGQTIDFAPLRDVKRGTKSLPLKAVASSGLPVKFYVDAGPARVEGNRLELTPLPPRTKYPVRVTVVAWQYGRTTHPEVATAEPVRQTFYIR